MITIENVLSVDKDRETVWRFFNEIESIAGCVPTCKSYRVIDGDTVDCDLRLKLGLIPLDSRATVRITERREGHHLEAMGETEAGEMTKKFGKVGTESKTKLHILLDLDEVDANETRIHFRINADAMGQMKRVYEAIIKGQREKLEAQFVENIARALGARVVIEGLPAPRDAQAV
ncbi:MAG: CoxG family protein [Thermodesulfobacteriota bacterium]